MRVFGWTADEGACAAYRIWFPFVQLTKDTDLDLSYGTDMPKEHQRESEVVIGQRVAVSGSTMLWRKWFNEGSKRLVFDMDDDLFSIEPHNRIPYEFWGKPENQELLRVNIHHSHTVTVSTEPLAQRIWEETRHEDIRVVPNAIPPWLIELEPERNALVGWGGSPTHDHDFRTVERQLKRFFEHNPKATFHTIGVDYLRRAGIPSSQYWFTRWVRGTEAFFAAIDYEIGIAPLAPSKFNRSKSDIKFLELAALGVPTIASDLAPYHTIAHGETGYLVKYEHEWGRHLRALAEDAELRQAIGSAARDYARSRTTEATAPLWLDAIRG